MQLPGQLHRFCVTIQDEQMVHTDTLLYRDCITIHICGKIAVSLHIPQPIPV